MIRRLTPLLQILALAAAAACDQGSTAPRTAGNTSFVISQGPAAAAAASLITLDDGGGHPGRDSSNSVPLSAIKSIDVRVTGIAVLPIGNDSIRDDQWIKLSTPGPVNLNLLALPTKADSGLLVTRGTLPPGKYGHLRILFDTATITFKETVSLLHGDSTHVFKADSTYPLFIGGFGMPDHDEDEAQAEADNHFGIVVPATTFTVTSDSSSTISIVFDAGSSVRRVVVTGDGLRLAPVLLAAGHGNGHGDGKKD